jgi:hypothetical protein
VRSILENPGYTGYAFFGRCARQEMLLDPDDVAAGHVIRIRRAVPHRVVRSRKPAGTSAHGMHRGVRREWLSRRLPTTASTRTAADERELGAATL